MSYRCQHCDHRFESDDDRPRCPQCLRMSTVAPTSGMSSARSSSSRSAERSQRTRSGLPWPLWVGVGVLGAVALAAAFGDPSAQPEGERLGMALTYAVLGGAGLLLTGVGIVSWLRGR